MSVNVTKYDFRNGAVRCQISKCVKSVSCIFTLTLVISEIITFVIVDLENMGQGHGELLS